MQSFRELLEVGKEPLALAWFKSKDKYKTNFTIKDINYEIISQIVESCDNNDIWEFKFYRDGNITRITGDFKTHFRVLSTVSAALEYIVKNVKPNILVFLASDDNKARKRLYQLNSDLLADKYNYISINPSIPKNDIIFGLCKTEEQMQCLLDMVG